MAQILFMIGITAFLSKPAHQRIKKQGWDAEEEGGKGPALKISS